MRDTAKLVSRWRSFVEYAQEVYEELKESTTLYDLSEDKPQPYDCTQGVS